MQRKDMLHLRSNAVFTLPNGRLLFEDLQE
jgi:hypothetical protein